MTRASLAFFVMLYLIINITLYVGGVRVVETDTSDFLGRFVDVEQYDQNGNLIVTDDLEESVPSTFQETGSGGIFTFIDALGAVVDFLIFIVNISFTLLALMTGLGLPPMAGVLVGLPLTVGFIIAIIYFVRSG